MNRGKHDFAQIFEFVPHNDFLKFVKKYGGDRSPGILAAGTSSSAWPSAS